MAIWTEKPIMIQPDQNPLSPRETQSEGQRLLSTTSAVTLQPLFYAFVLFKAEHLEILEEWICKSFLGPSHSMFLLEGALAFGRPTNDWQFWTMYSRDIYIYNRQKKSGISLNYHVDGGNNVPAGLFFWVENVTHLIIFFRLETLKRNNTPMSPKKWFMNGRDHPKSERVKHIGWSIWGFKKPHLVDAN
jgi:hypothetical protein